MSGASAGYHRPVIVCENCDTPVSLLFGVKNYHGVERLPDPFTAKCPLCKHEADYEKSDIQMLVSLG